MTYNTLTSDFQEFKDHEEYLEGDALRKAYKMFQTDVQESTIKYCTDVLHALCAVCEKHCKYQEEGIKRQDGIKLNAGVAQLAEHLTCNEDVVGSTPTIS